MISFKNIQPFIQRFQRVFQKNELKTAQDLKANNVSIILMGGAPGDPAAPGMIRQIMKELYAKKIPQILCVEQPSDLSLEEYEQRTNQWIEVNKIFISKQYISEYLNYNPNLASPYFTFNEYEKIKHKFSGVENRDYVIFNLFSYLIHEEMSLLLKQTKELNIPYRGIERIEKDIGMGDDSRDVRKDTDMLIKTMTENIFNKAFSEIKNTGGVILVSASALLTTELSASIFNHITNNKLDQNDLKTYHTIFISDYSSSQRNRIANAMLKSIGYLNREVLNEVLKDMPLDIINIVETRKHRYSSSEFDKIMREIEHRHPLRSNE